MIGNINEHIPINATPIQRNPREPANVRGKVAQPTRYWAIGIILALALFAFEAFNFDTTKFALENLLGPVSFAGVGWATILAIAFCGIDFAGLLRVFTPDDEVETKPEVWYLMAAWLLGATMNAIMTWYAVSVTLLDNNIGNEILAREQLLTIVPIFVAMLVWLTRILFIGALSVAGGRLIEQIAKVQVTIPEVPARQTAVRPVRHVPMPVAQPQPARIKENPNRSVNRPTYHPAPAPALAQDDDELEGFIAPMLPEYQDAGVHAR